jgi:NADH-quinone oxidoreductase subunit C
LEAGAILISQPSPAMGLSLSAVLGDDRKLLWAARALKEAGYFLADLSVAQFREGYLLTYHFSSLDVPKGSPSASEARLPLALRILLPEAKPQVSSLYPVFQGAEWHERESADFYGIVFQGNPNPVPLLLPDDFSSPPPLRKSPESLASLAALAALNAGGVLFGKTDYAHPDFAALFGAEKAPSTENGASKEGSKAP